MAVNLTPPDPKSLLPVAGVDLGVAYAGIRKVKRHDLMLMRLGPGARVAGVFTQNAFAAAPVQVCRQHLAASETIRALVVNAGKVLTHPMILRAVWGPGYAEDSQVLRTYINQLRSKLHDDPSAPRFIMTDPGVGYRFLMPESTS